MNTEIPEHIVDLRALNTEREPAKQNAHREIRWETEEFPYREKNPQWFLIGGILLFGVCASLVILKNFFGAAVMLLFGVVIYMHALKKPAILTVIVSARGITVNDKLTPYEAITSFWVIYEPPVKELILIKKDRFHLKTVVPLGDADPVALREALIEQGITEQEEQESISEIIARRLGF